MPLSLFSGHDLAGPLNYARPYLVAAMVGCSLYSAPALLSAIFTSSIARWIAQISYGLYVSHGMLAETWLGSGDAITKYAKRPLLLGVTFFAAHLSFKYFEMPIQKRGKLREKTAA
jgi:peptidoglycan/LPS O-acetylase OafA/YrhL